MDIYVAVFLMYRNGRSEFFDRLAEGDLVKARFRSNAWDQIEFED